MKITTITIFFSIVAALEILRTLSRLKREFIGIRSALVWIVLWGCIGFFSLFPNLLDAAMRLAQMENRMFFLLIVAVFILFALLFNLTSRYDRMDRNIGKLVQEIAILDYKLENLKHDKQEQ